MSDPKRWTIDYHALQVLLVEPEERHECIIDVVDAKSYEKLRAENAELKKTVATFRSEYEHTVELAHHAAKLEEENKHMKAVIESIASGTIYIQGSKSPKTVCKELLAALDTDKGRG